MHCTQVPQSSLPWLSARFLWRLNFRIDDRCLLIVDPMSMGRCREGSAEYTPSNNNSIEWNTCGMTIVLDLDILREHYTRPLSVIIRTSQPQDLPVLINATPKQLLNNLTIQDRLSNDPFNMPRFNSSIPDPLPSQIVPTE